MPKYASQLFKELFWGRDKTGIIDSCFLMYRVYEDRGTRCQGNVREIGNVREMSGNFLFLEMSGNFFFLVNNIQNIKNNAKK